MRMKLSQSIHYQLDVYLTVLKFIGILGLKYLLASLCLNLYNHFTTGHLLMSYKRKTSLTSKFTHLQPANVAEYRVRSEMQVTIMNH